MRDRGANRIELGGPGIGTEGCENIVETAAPLQEGAVETTARLQGVCLGANLVLLDTPGLHSVTPENAALTQRFTDSADAVLWLTNSTSPGQVQELDELVRELRRLPAMTGVPIILVTTESDAQKKAEAKAAGATGWITKPFQPDQLLALAKKVLG